MAAKIIRRKVVETKPNKTEEAYKELLYELGEEVVEEQES